MFRLSADQTFFDLFDQAADNIAYAAELYLQMLRNFEIQKEFAAKIRETEQRGDSLTHETLTKLNQTFITPLDREDIHTLCSQLDDIVDYLEAAAKRITLYGITKPNEDSVKQAAVAVEITRTLAQAVKGIRHIKEQEKLGKLLIEVDEWENRGDEHNHAALARLFATNDPMHVLRWKEMYDLVEEAIDACETAANTIRTIMVKNA